MGVHGILECLNDIDSELLDLRDHESEETPPEDFDWSSWPEAHLAPDLDRRPEWQQGGFESKDQWWEWNLLAGKVRKEYLLLQRTMLNDEFSLEEDLWYAIQRGEVATVRYLLEQGTDPHMLSSLGRTGALATACELGQLECAKLLREYGAELSRDYDREHPNCEPSPELVALLAPQDRPPWTGELGEGFRFPPRSRAGRWAREEARRQAGYAEEEAERQDAVIPVVDWLASRPPQGNKTRSWETLPPDPGPPESWEERFPAPPGVDWVNVRDVLSWHQAVRAADPVLRRWARVRKSVQKRIIALYWQERTQKNLCAAGGRGRAEDKETFERDIAWSEC